MAAESGLENSNSAFPTLHWDVEQVEESLKLLYDFTVSEVEGSLNWYQVKSRPKKRWAQILRVLAISATGLAGMIPILSQIVPKNSEALQIIFNPAWASVAIALAATALGLDRFFGFSTAWMRFIASELKITGKLQAFRYNWESERMMWQGKRPDYETAQAMVTRCAKFAAEISEIVQDETQSWVEEFQGTLKTLDANLKSQIQSARSGAISVTVANGDQCEEGWTLMVEGKSAESHYGTTGVISDVSSGLHKVIVQGKIKDKRVEAEAAVQVPADGVAPVTVTLG